MILVTGSDGYIGAEYLAKHDALAIDNHYKRSLMGKLGVSPLYPVKFLHERGINNNYINIGKWESLSRFIKTHKPETIIHLAEECSAPYSMRGREEALSTVDNNLFGTLNLIYAIRDYSPETHLIKLGSMGTYGCPDVEIPEGWFDLEYKGRQDRLLFPSTPHSIYHLSKVFDSNALAFACRMWGLRVTDLHQGYVYGSNGVSRFSYDDTFGTVLNRFIVQAVAGIPLTVYGEGGQTRGMIHINDTVKCLNLAAQNPPPSGEYRVANQLTEWKTINEVAELVREVTDCKIDHIRNPRIEKEEHFYKVEHKVMKDYGLEPQLLDKAEIQRMVDLVKEHKSNIRREQIYPKIQWRRVC